MLRQVLFALLMLVSIGLFLRRAEHLIRILRTNAPEPRPRLDKIPDRIRSILVYVGGHKQMFRFNPAGVLHFFIFWGFLVLLTVSLSLVGEGLFNWVVPVVATWPPLLLMQEFFGLLVISGVLIALYQRYVLKPVRFAGSHASDAFFILYMIGGLMITMYALNAGKIGLGEWPEGIYQPPIAAFFGRLFESLPEIVKRVGFELAWWGHAGILFGFLVYLPYSKHMHVITAVPNIFLRNLESKGELKPINFEDESLETFGVGKIEELPWKQAYDTLVCTECGRCTAVCPATMAGTPLNPKLLIMNLRDHMIGKGEAKIAGGELLSPLPVMNTLEARFRKSSNGNGANGASGGHDSVALAEGKAQTDHDPLAELNRALVGDVITDEVLWACTTCRACMEECPVMIEHVHDIVDMRRYLSLTEGRVPDTLSITMRQTQQSGNPWGRSPSERMDWAEGLDVPVMAEKGSADVLYWVGCSGSYDPRNIKITQAVVKILKAANVDFAVLGDEEKCNAEWARRAGEENLFQTATTENIETMKQYQFNTVICHCPHCFNTLKNEYPQFGGNFKVMHHSEYIAQLLAEGRIKPEKAQETTMAYHDSCYLGRYNLQYDAPREVLKAIPGVNLVELPRSRDRGLCCGGGGAQMWMETHQEKRVNVIRMEEIVAAADAVASGKPGNAVIQAEGIGHTNGTFAAASACPFCLTMLDDARRGMEVDERIDVKDIAEYVAQALA